MEKMERSLFLFILMGSFSTCRLDEFHFIQEEKTWTEAQKYCREKYTDLVTVKNMTDVMRLRNSVNYTGEAWIGLYKYKTGPENRRWHWSLPTVEFNQSETNWARGNWPTRGRGANCVYTAYNEPIESGFFWINWNCGHKLPFLCYDEKNITERIHFINEEKTWRDAQSYCREHHTDLISGMDQLKKIPDNLKEPIKKNKHGCWIGLFRDNWWWSDGINSSFRKWDNDQRNNTRKNKCVTMLSETGKWKAENCNNTKTFFCYDDKVILIQEKKTWSEALSYCREKHHDLVSITDPSQQRWVQARVKNATTSHVWLGLRYTCALDFWFWVNNEVVCYQNWIKKDQTEGCDKSGAMERGGKWVKKCDEKKFNFICLRRK